MKFKLHENLPVELTELFAAANHDAHTVLSEGLSGRDDRVIFDAAVAEERLLVTQDLDFSDIRKFRPGTHPGILLVRLRDPSRRMIIERFRQLLSQYDFNGWSGCFVVLGDRKLRVQRP